MSAPEPEPTTFPARGGRAAVVLHATGFRHPRALRRGEAFTPYADLTHVVAGPRALRIGTRRGVLGFRRGDLVGDGAHLALAAALRARVGALPDGAARLARMEALDRQLVHPGRRLLARAAVLGCVLVFGLQLWLFPHLEMAGMFSAELVRAGEWWRLVTANLLHGGLSHLLLNTLALLVLGDLLERQIRAAALGFVMAASALGAMGAGLLADYASALGASGVVAGLVGALLVVEVRTPERIPAPWRLPRAVVLAAIAAETAVLAWVPGVAHAAHAGGFLAGALAARLLPPPGGRSAWLLPVDALAGLGVALALGAVVSAAVLPDPQVVQRRAERLLEIPDLHPTLLNNEAWRIATAEDPPPELLRVAERLAERAAEATGRRDPNVLDTLAEVHFQSGDRERALRVIEQAIALAPDEPYYREQRRRFLGERDPDDRPPPPERLPPPPEEERLPIPDAPGIPV